MQALAEIELAERISVLLELSQRFGPVLPTFGVVSVEGGTWECECRKQACRNPGKHPRITNWRTWTYRATEDLEQIASWAAKWPGANWAVEPKVAIVDLDRKPGKPDGVTCSSAPTEMISVAKDHRQRPSQEPVSVDMDHRIDIQGLSSAPRWPGQVAPAEVLAALPAFTQYIAVRRAV